MLIVEGVSDAVLVRQFGRAWAAGDPIRQRFIDALTITVFGARVGRWPVDLLASPGDEIADRIAILKDTDTRGDGKFNPPDWIINRDPQVVQAFYSVPTLEPWRKPEVRGWCWWLGPGWILGGSGDCWSWWRRG
ncbi:MAG TPA: hypothetical protein VFQ44_13215 [Streptosporangiaceae bacterium]|nr:hypothetical protein [Streptosporangiaceae bacterium]